MSMTVTIDIEKLNSIFSETDAAKAVKGYLSARHRGRPETNLKRVQRILTEGYEVKKDGSSEPTKIPGAKLSYQEIVDTFRKLQPLGIGKLVLKRGGKSGRFIWNANLKSMIEVLEGKRTEFQKQKSAVKKVNMPSFVAAAEDSEPKKQPAKVAATVNVKGGHMIVVRKGDTALEVPADLTPAEAKGVASLFKELSLAS